MAMPAPPVMPAPPNLGPQLRAVRALARVQERTATSVLQKVGFWVVAVVIGAAIVLVIIAEGKREIDPDQRWFWEPEWLAGELEADREIAAGQGTRYDSDEAWEASLRARLKPE